MEEKKEMLYVIPVGVRIIALPRTVPGIDNWQYSLDNMVRHGKLQELDNIGFYLLADDEVDTSPDKVRNGVPTEISGQVVVKAGSIYEAMGRFMEHPGVAGTGRERQDKKAIWLKPE